MNRQVPPTRQCPECGRVFDLTNEQDADEWAYGHDCEVYPDSPSIEDTASDELLALDREAFDL